jgi:hypothetical protein
VPEFDQLADHYDERVALGTFGQFIQALGGADDPAGDVTVAPEQFVHSFRVGGIEMRELVVAIVARVERIGRIAGREDVIEPPPFDPGHVLQQAEQGEGGGWDTGADQLFAGEALALLQQCGPMEIKPCVERRQLVADERRVGACDARGHGAGATC